MIVISGYSAAQSSDGGGSPDVATVEGSVDLSWLLYHFSDRHCIMLIDHVEPPAPVDAATGSAPPVTAQDTAYRIYPNEGREASAYLRFIVDHYYNLPARTVFIHGSRRSWHNGDLVVLLKHLNWSLSYANLNHKRELPGDEVEIFSTKYRVGPVEIPFRYQPIETIWNKTLAPISGRSRRTST